MARKKNSTKEDFYSEFESLKPLLSQLYFDYYKSLLFNNIVIEGLQADEPQEYALNILFNQGVIYASNQIETNNQFYLYKLFKALETKRFGVSKYISVDLGFNDARSSKLLKMNSDVFELKFNPLKVSLSDWLDFKTKELVRIDIAILNNVIASNFSLLVATDKANELSLKQAFLESINGAIAVFGTEGLLEATKGIPVNVPIITDKLQAQRDAIISEIETMFGIVKGNSNKRERVESFELPTNEAIDNIYMYIDTFNRDATRYNIPLKMRLNGAIEELHNNENNEEKDVITNE